MSSSNTYMNQAKRRLNEDISVSDETKKLRRTTSDKNDISITCIEDLSSEVFYEIFDYFDSGDICKAFLNLNTRFNHLITRSSLPMKIYRSVSSSQISEDHYEQIIIPNRHRITLIYMRDQLQVSLFFATHTVDSSFSRLESLVLYGISYETLISLLPNLTTLPRFYSLNISLSGIFRNFIELYRLVFRLPYLKYTKLSAVKNSLNYILPYNIKEFSPVEYFVIDYRCGLHELINILSYTPRLSHLSCRNIGSARSKVKEIPTAVSHLTHVSFNPCYLSFNDLEIFITKLFSHTKVLRVTTSFDSSYLDPDRWERLIRKYMPHLRVLDLKYSKTLYIEHTLEPYHLLLNQFILPFWIERRWCLELKICINCSLPSTISYSIHSLKKQWYDYMIDSPTLTQQKCNNSSLSRLHLILENHQTSEYYQPLLEYIPSILTLVQITCLHIDLEQFSISILINFLCLLSNLNSLTVTSKFPEQTKILSEEQTNSIDSISMNNKIIQVNLEQMTELDQVHILMNLCSHMINLQVKCRNNVDLEWLIRYVLMKRNTNFIPHLSSLCLWISNANDRMTKNLQTIIDTEKLLTNYTIKRICDRIYLRWNAE